MSLLAQLLRSGLVAPGDLLTHVRPAIGTTFRAVVLPDGRIETSEGTVHDEPSPAARAFYGTLGDGWGYWTHDRSGLTLSDLHVCVTAQEVRPTPDVQ